LIVQAVAVVVLPLREQMEILLLVEMVVMV
jgi:hypothetical protein